MICMEMLKNGVLIRGVLETLIVIMLLIVPCEEEARMFTIIGRVHEDLSHPRPTEVFVCVVLVCEESLGTIQLPLQELVFVG